MTIPKKMHALVKEEKAPGLKLKEVPVPEIGNNDLLIEIEKTAICGTDLHIYNWDEWSQKNIHPPRITGHEFVGKVVSIGKDVSGYRLGERVSGEGHVTCGVCRNCRRGRAHLCIHTHGVGIQRDGCFAHYLKLPAKNAVHIPDDISSEMAAIMDPYGNATHATLSFDLVGEDVLITGAGPIGLMSCAIARHVGARHIVISDVQEYRLELAKKLGATRAINVKETTVDKTMEELNMIGFDVGLEMSGNAKAFSSMISNMHPSGKISLLGILPNDTQIPWDDVIFKGLFLKGIYGREIFETWHKMQTMLQSGLDLNPIITHRFDFKDYEEGFATMNTGKSGKVILDWLA